MPGISLIQRLEPHLAASFAVCEEIAFQNQHKVLEAFRHQKIREQHFHGSSGYGYDDIGRDDLERVYADIFRAEDAIVRSQIVSGTHAISACLFGLLRPGDRLISLAGSPYDTLSHVIGQDRPERGTLCERGIHYSEMPLDSEGRVQIKLLPDYIDATTRMVLIQRSRGYSLRPAINLNQMKILIAAVKQRNPSCIVMVDNCYGEFTETIEPVEIGADIIAGSLIKNPGGGLAMGGGYICGRQSLLAEIADFLTAPGLGKALGASSSANRQFYQGLFLAPHVVLQALKSAILMAGVFEHLTYPVYPKWNEQRSDIVQVLCLQSAEKLLRFARIVQAYSPVDSDVIPEFSALPGYTDEVVMAAGTFVQGSSIELSADAPRREPYCVYCQGGLTYEHSRLVISKLIEEFA